MNCRTFERELPEWIGGRLAPRQAQQMQDHQAACADCRKSAQLERVLQRQWQNLPRPNPVPALWPRVAAHIAAATPRRRPAFLRPAAFGGMTAAGGLCGLLLTTRPAAPPAAYVTPAAETLVADERPLVQMMNRMQQSPEEASETLLSENQDRKQAQRLLLLGKEGQ